MKEEHTTMGYMAIPCRTIRIHIAQMIPLHRPMAEGLAVLEMPAAMVTDAKRRFISFLPISRTFATAPLWTTAVRYRLFPLPGVHCPS